MFCFSLKARLINRCGREPFLLGSEQLKHLMKAMLKHLSSGTRYKKHQLNLFEDRNDGCLRQLWNAKAANAVESLEDKPSLAS